MGNKDVIQNVPSFDKGILARSDQLIHQRFKPIDKDLRNDFVKNITKTYRPKLIDIIKEGFFWNKGNESMVKRFE